MRRVTFWLTLTLLSVLVFGQVAVLLGTDANWDLRNYHLYNPFALVEGSQAGDHNAAGIQTYINPTLDLFLTYPGYVLGGLRLSTRIMGAVQGVSFVLIMGIVLALKQSLGTRDPRLHLVFAAGAALLGMTGALTISEIGTSFGDLTTAVAVLCGVLLALRSASEQGTTGSRRLVAAAGLALGIATGLKLTNGVYLVALGVALVFLDGRGWIKTALAFGGGAAVGLLATYGWWSWYLWQETGNPVFPYFNRLFDSPLYPHQNFFDERFYAKNWWQALAYPFWFSWNSQTAEIPFFDLRFPIAYILAVALSIKLSRETLAKGGAAEVRQQRRPLALLTIFLIVGFVLWQGMFSIQRYAVAMELLLPAFILVALTVLLGRLGWMVFAAIAALLALTTRVPDWGRLKDDQALLPLVPEQVRVALAPRFDDAAVILGEPPLAYVAVAFPHARTTWVGYSLSDQDQERARRKIAVRSRLVIIRRPTERDEDITGERLKQLGLPRAGPGTAGCQELPTVFEPLVLCEVATHSP